MNVHAEQNENPASVILNLLSLRVYGLQLQFLIRRHRGSSTSLQLDMVVSKGPGGYLSPAS